MMQINDEDYSIAISMFFNVEWREPRLKMEPSFGASLRAGDNSTEQVMVPTDVELVDDLWVPNIFIYNLKTFKVIDVLSKLNGLWIDTDKNVLYSQATQITTICPMRFDKFPLDTQTCKFRVGSYSYDSSKLLFTTKNAGKKSSTDLWDVKSCSQGTPPGGTASRLTTIYVSGAICLKSIEHTSHRPGTQFSYFQQSIS